MVPKEVEMILARQLASYLALPMFLVDPVGTLIFYNEPAEAILGVHFQETGEMPAAEWATIFKPHDEHGQVVTPSMLPLIIAITTRRPAHSTFWITAADSSRHYLEVTAIPVVGQARTVPGRDGDFLGSAAMTSLTLWGTRGSLAAPGPETARYGGNTSCACVNGPEGTVLVLDAGTGLRRLGRALPDNLKRVDILLTHLHMDHIQGLGFFGPLRNPEIEVHIWGPASTTADLLSATDTLYVAAHLPVRCSATCRACPFCTKYPVRSVRLANSKSQRPSSTIPAPPSDYRISTHS